MIDISIQIINYNTKKYLKVCLDTLLEDLKGSGLSCKIYVLDNCSNDDLADFELMYKNKAEFLYSDVNRGFGGGHNYLSRCAQSKYILILNSDIRFFEPNTVKRLYDAVNGTEYKVTGPALLLEDGTQQEFDHGELKGIKAWIKNNYASSYWIKRDRKAEAAWIAGTVFLIERAAFESVNGFDENFFLYKEEEELCLRLRNAGVKILYYPEAKVIHKGHVVARRDKHFTNSMNYYIRKHFKKNIVYNVLNAVKILRDYALHGRVRERE